MGRALRQPGVARWLVLLQVSDLLLDILTGFLALYLVDVVRTTPEQAALAVAIRLGAGLAGDVVLIRVLDRVSGLSLLRASAAAAALLYPGFLLVPGFGPKLVVLAVLTMVTAPWYPVLQAQLYRSLPGESGVVVSLSSASTLLSARCRWPSGSWPSSSAWPGRSPAWPWPRWESSAGSGAPARPPETARHDDAPSARWRRGHREMSPASHRPADVADHGPPAVGAGPGLPCAAAPARALLPANGQF